MIPPTTDVAADAPKSQVRELFGAALRRGGGTTSAGSEPRWPAVVVAIGSVLATLFWTIAAALSAGHGFDVSDEGFYLLSYRWWSDNLYAYSGVQYVYGPVFELLGHDIAGLRLFRLVSVLVTHAVLGWTFMSWLRPRRPNAPASRWWELAGTSAIVAAGGMVYCWLPTTPGYNDVSLLGGLLACAVVLRMARDVERGARVPLWVPAALGPLAVAMILAKSASSLLTLAIVGTVALVVLRRTGRRAILRAVAAAVVGALLTLAAIHFFLVPLTAAIPPMISINRTVAAGTNSPSMLLEMYAENAWQLLVKVVRGYGALLLAGAIAPFVRGNARAWRWAVAALTVLGLAQAVRHIIRADELVGGTVNLNAFPTAITATIALGLVVGIATLIRDRFDRTEPSALSNHRRRDWAVLTMVAVLPLTQAAGTGNPVHYLAMNALAAWVALVVTVVTGLPESAVAARGLTALALAGAVSFTAVIGADGVWNHPYRTQPRGLTTESVPGVSALDGVKLGPDTAARYADLHQRLAPWIEPPGRAIMAFDELSGSCCSSMAGRSARGGTPRSTMNVRPPASAQSAGTVTPGGDPAHRFCCSIAR